MSQKGVEFLDSEFTIAMMAVGLPESSHQAAMIHDDTGYAAIDINAAILLILI
jgi:hypothetical protein